MEPWLQVLLAVFTSTLASSGLWAFLSKKSEHKDVKTKMLLGLGHDRIMSLGIQYIERGYITTDEFENLNDYLYAPYRDLGGNGSAKRLMEQVEKLPIKKADYEESKKKEVYGYVD